MVCFSLTLDDGREVEWQVQGESPTDALRELAQCWTLRLGDAADFGAAEIASVLFLGELHQEELEPVLAKMRVVSPLRAASAPERGGQSSG